MKNHTLGVFGYISSCLIMIILFPFFMAIVIFVASLPGFIFYPVVNGVFQNQMGSTIFCLLIGWVISGFLIENCQSTRNSNMEKETQTKWDECKRCKKITFLVRGTCKICEHANKSISETERGIKMDYFKDRCCTLFNYCKETGKCKSCGFQHTSPNVLRTNEEKMATCQHCGTTRSMLRINPEKGCQKCREGLGGEGVIDTENSAKQNPLLESFNKYRQQRDQLFEWLQVFQGSVSLDGRKLKINMNNGGIDITDTLNGEEGKKITIVFSSPHAIYERWGEKNKVSHQNFNSIAEILSGYIQAWGYSPITQPESTNTQIKEALTETADKIKALGEKYV